MFESLQQHQGSRSGPPSAGRRAPDGPHDMIDRAFRPAFGALLAGNSFAMMGASAAIVRTAREFVASCLRDFEGRVQSQAALPQ